jgi:hypothetical protein
MRGKPSARGGENGGGKDGSGEACRSGKRGGGLPLFGGGKRGGGRRGGSWRRFGGGKRGGGFRLRRIGLGAVSAESRFRQQ